MPKEVNINSRFEDIYANRKAFPAVYEQVRQLVEVKAPEVTPRIEVKSPIDQIREDWTTEKHTPEFVTRVNTRILELVQPFIEISFTMPRPFPASYEDLSTHEKEGQVALFQPAEFSTPEGRFHLARGFKALGNVYVPEHSSVQKGNNVKNIKLHADWRYIDGQTDAPYLGMSATKAKKDLFKDGYEGIDENELLTLGFYNKVTKNEYPDQNGTWTWVLNSSRDRRPVHAGFGRYGRFDLRGLLSTDLPNSRLGVRRSSGVK